MDVNIGFEISDRDRLDWVEFWSRSSHPHPRQHPLSAEIILATGNKPVYAIGRSDGRITCVGLFSIRPWFGEKRYAPEAFCQRGPVFDDPSVLTEFLDQVCDFFRSLRTGIVGICPYWIYPEAEAARGAIKSAGFVGGREPTGRVDLSRSEEEILASFSKKVRRRVREASAANIEIRPAKTWDEAKQAYDCLASMRSKRGIVEMTEEEFRATWEHFLKHGELGVVLNAYLGSEFLSAIWLLRSNHTAHSPVFAIDQEAMDRLAKNITIGLAMFFESFLWAKSKGCQWFDLEGSVEANDPEAQTYQIQKFKSRLEPVAVQRINHCTKTTYAPMRKLVRFLRKTERLWRYARSLPYQISVRMKRNKGEKN